MSTNLQRIFKACLMADTSGEVRSALAVTNVQQTSTGGVDRVDTPAAGYWGLQDTKQEYISGDDLKCQYSPSTSVPSSFAVCPKRRASAKIVIIDGEAGSRGDALAKSQ